MYAFIADEKKVHAFYRNVVKSILVDRRFEEVGPNVKKAFRPPIARTLLKTEVTPNCTLQRRIK